MKKLSNLKGVKSLSKKEQRKIEGGRAPLCCIEWNPVTRHCSKWDYNCLEG